MAAQSEPRLSGAGRGPEVAAVLITDEEGTIRFVGGAVTEMLGADAAETVGTTAEALFATTPTGTPADVRDSGAPARWDGVVLRPPAPKTPRSITVFPMMGGAPGSMVVVSSVPEPNVDQDREQALQMSNAQLESFASVAAHDLQEPLRKIRAFSDRIRSFLDPVTAGHAPPRGVLVRDRPTASARVIPAALTVGRFLPRETRCS